MSFFYDAEGNKQDVKLEASIYQEARDAGQSVAQLINTKYGDKGAKAEYGSVFDQLCAAEGLSLVGATKNPFGRVSPVLADVLDGKSSFSAAGGTNTQGRGTPYGTESRILFPAAVIEMIEDQIQPDRTTDDVIFRSLVASTLSVAKDTFEQPVISYNNVGGANSSTSGARAQRISQLGGTPMMLALTTSERVRKLPTYGIGIEMSEQALKATTLDLLVMTVNRYTQIEKDARVNAYLSSIFAGDLDLNSGAVPAVTTISLDSSAPAGTMTHRAWVKFLARRRKLRKITHVVADIDTYLKVEGRTGRPGTNNYDPTLTRVDPQVDLMNNTFGGNVKWFIVDSAADGGPVPANTIWALDREQAMVLVKNTEADFKATEDFILRRSKVMVWHWGEDVYRMYGDADLTPFDVLTIS